jgi:hypothetical protein
MAIAKLEFDLNDPDDSRAHLRSVHSLDMAHFIWNLKHNQLRTLSKEEVTASVVIQFLYDEMDNLPFDIDQLIV